MPSTKDGPLLIAYDGSPPARRAVDEAAALFGPRAALVVTVWEPGLAFEAAMPITGSDMPQMPVDVEAAREIGHEMETHAERVSKEGAEYARSGGRRRERFGQLVEHLLLALAHPLGVEAHEAALLGRFGGTLGGSEQPLAVRLGLLRRGFLGDQAVDRPQLVQDGFARQRPPLRLEVAQRILAPLDLL